MSADSTALLQRQLERLESEQGQALARHQELQRFIASAQHSPDDDPCQGYWKRARLKSAASESEELQRFVRRCSAAIEATRSRLELQLEDAQHHRQRLEDSAADERAALRQWLQRQDEP
ncbi:MAG: hypothetical protein RBU37_23990 [Myxococcota bacterium]|jgi:hypothetical protein|nr:hypothetical protein [Myxococcota bacterium]